MRAIASADAGSRSVRRKTQASRQRSQRLAASTASTQCRSHAMKHIARLMICLLPVGAVHAGGSNYGITPGTHPDLAGKVSEWPVPTPRFARDPAVAPDGSIYITVMNGNRIARFDEKTKAFKEWDLPQ